MNWYKLSKEVSNKYSWTYVNLPSKIVETLIEFGKEIDPDDLYVKEAEDGLELEPHITVKYAILTNEFKDVKDLLKGEKKGKFYLGESSIFEHDKYDVVKIDVESDDLKRLHEKLNNLPHEDKYPEYHAHATIAYLKSGKGKKYVGKFKIDKSFTFDELFFGDQDKKDHKIKLAFNLNQYRYAQIWNVEIGEDFDDKIAALYELEYKYSMVSGRFKGIPKRRDNILKNLEPILNEVLEEVKSILINVFQEWLNKHALLSADTWARERTNENMELGDDDAYRSMIGEYIRYVIYHGENHYPTDQSAPDRYLNEMLNKAKKNIENFPVFSKLLEQGLYGYKETLRNDLYDEGLKEFGRINGKRFRNQDQAENYIDKLTVKDVALESLFYSDSIKDFVDVTENIGVTEGVLEEFYKNFVFPHWVKYWMDQGIAETRKEVESVYNQLQQISPNNIKGSLAIISIALNTSHQSGDMLDYIADYAGYHGNPRYLKSFLDEMTSGNRVEQWNVELREVGVEI